MYPAYSNEVNLIKERAENFEWPLCCEEYDDDAMFPMILCSEQHSACKTCVD